MKTLIRLFIVICFGISNAQEIQQQDLSSASFDYLIAKIFEHEENDSLKNRFADAYLKKAKQINAFDETSIGYYIKGISTNFPSSVKYLDSVLQLGKAHGSQKYFPETFLEYGNALYDNGNYSDAFRFYLNAKKNSDSLGRQDISYAANINIAYLKEVSGDYSGAKDIYLENSQILESLFEGDLLIEKQLSNYHALAYAYLKLDQIDSMSFYNQLGYFLSSKTTDESYPAIFRLVGGISQYESKKYASARDSILQVLIPFEIAKDTFNLAYSYMYLGKIALERFDTVKAIQNLEKAHYLIEAQESKIPDLSDIYKSLWTINKVAGNTEKELQYLTSYIEYETELTNEFKELYPAINKEYDIPNLISEKESVISRLNEKNSSKTFLISLLLLLSLAIMASAIYQSKRRTYYKSKVEEVIRNLEEKNNRGNNTERLKVSGISEEVVKEILQKLDYFEQHNQFLDNALTLNRLAEKFETNSSYLSKVVNTYKDSSFSKYLSALRIEYIIKELVANQQMRNYTVKAIAREAGFNNAESFSRAFREKAKIYPSAFIKTINTETKKEV